MSNFETHPKTLKEELLTLIHTREMALPDFQRDFVWQPRQTKALILSLARSFPAGSLLRIEHSEELLGPREFVTAPPLNGHRPKYLVLDGQQRLTSLYLSLYGTGDYLYFVNMKTLMSDEYEDVEDKLEEAFFYERRARGEKRYGTRAQQAESYVLPLEEIFGGEGFFNWLDEIDQVTEEHEDLPSLTNARRRELRKAYEGYVEPIANYKFPVVTLPANTSLEAVCTIFETLNNTGVRLSVFDLLTSRFYPKGINLREWWAEALEDTNHLANFGIDPYYILQVITSRTSRSVKRSDVLKLKPEDVERYWKDAIWGMDEALGLLFDDCGVLKPDLLSYNTIVIPMASVFMTNRGLRGAAEGSLRSNMKQWYWCSVFNQWYERNPTSQTIVDVGELSTWVGGGQAPNSVREFAFEMNDLYSTTTRQRAIYRGLLCLVLSKGSLDFHSTKSITAGLMAEKRVDDHHVFPKAYLNSLGQDWMLPEEGIPIDMDSILNRTLIDRKTNQIIGKKAPQIYLTEIAEEMGWGKLNQVLASHYLPVGDDSSLASNDFVLFCQERADALYSLIEEATSGS